MEPDRQVEIQLGHMCNNRCVFCVSGQRTALGEAGPMPVEPILAAIRAAREVGHRKITLLGGEPTLQPGFMRIVRETVALGFEEIVLFTNGVKTARAELIDELRATGGRFTWRISIQGASEASHEATTKKPGSFARIVRTLEHLAARGERITVNMCVVESNFVDVDLFPALLLPHGVDQLHLDMIRPLDAGDRTREELDAMIPRYAELAAPLRRMVRGFPAGFDVNIGNLPPCVAPDLAPHIHHDGSPTQTIAIDGDDRLSRPWNKYLVKKRDKIKTPDCARCVFDRRCSGVYETYAELRGTRELVPVSPETARDADPAGRLAALWLPPLLGDLEGIDVESVDEDRVRVALKGAELETRAVGTEEGAIGRYGSLSFHLRSGRPTVEELARLASSLITAGLPPIAPFGPDAGRSLPTPLALALRRLRAAAPFGHLQWEHLELEGKRAELRLRCPEGSTAHFFLALEGGRPRSGYRLEGEPTESLVAGLRAILEALERRAPSSAGTPARERLAR